MVLGVTTLITVLSVMNGFSHELTERILALTPHGRVIAEDGIEDWKSLRQIILETPDVIDAHPFAERKVIISSSTSKSGAIVTGLRPSEGDNIYSISVHHN